MAEEKHGSVTITRAHPAPTPAQGERDPWAGVFKPRKEPEMAKEPEIKMEALKIHLGPTGGQVRKGASYTLHSEAQAGEHVRLGIGERLSPAAPAEQEEAAKAKDEDADKPWTMQVSPETYLERWPEGQHAEQARRIIAAKAAE